MTTNQKRQPKGISTGGQFAADVNPESAVDLEDIEEAPFSYVYPGDVTNVRAGSRTPWGTADYVEHIAPGIVVVGTAGHGGVKLSPERNRKIPLALRNSSGWYEEDCEVYIPMAYHPEAFVRDGQTVEKTRSYARGGLVNWFPEKYEEVFGVEIGVGASLTKDQHAWNELHKDDDVAVSAISVENGMVKVTVRRGGHGGEDSHSDREILVPKEDYSSDEFRHPLGLHHGSFVVNPSKGYRDVTPPPAPPKDPAPRYRGIDTSSMTASAQQRVEINLRKQFRFQDGSTHTVKEIIESGGITGKSYMEKGGGRNTYYLRMASEAEGQPSTDSMYALEVSKATWDAVNAPAS